MTATERAIEWCKAQRIPFRADYNLHDRGETCTGCASVAKAISDAVAEELERCAKIADDYAVKLWHRYKGINSPTKLRADPRDEGGGDAAEVIAAAIRGGA